MEESPSAIERFIPFLFDDWARVLALFLLLYIVVVAITIVVGNGVTFTRETLNHKRNLLFISFVAVVKDGINVDPSKIPYYDIYQNVDGEILSFLIVYFLINFFYNVSKDTFRQQTWNMPDFNAVMNIPASLLSVFFDFLLPLFFPILVVTSLLVEFLCFSLFIVEYGSNLSSSALQKITMFLGVPIHMAEHILSYVDGFWLWMSGLFPQLECEMNLDTTVIMKY